MPIDATQFHKVFFEESFEGLDTMESGLLRLGAGDGDPETIDEIFRAAHSIKGGSGTFGFAAVSGFTHVVETLLDEMRQGARAPDREAIDLLLGSVDCLRELLSAARDGSGSDPRRVAEVQAGLERMVGAPGPIPLPAAADSPGAGWRIDFRPHPHLFHTGNDPVRMFRELAALGRLRVAPDCSAVPPFPELDPETSYLAWTLDLEGAATRAQVAEVFEWVEGDCELDIVPLAAAPEAAVTGPAPETADPGAASAERRAGEDRRRSDGRAGADASSIRVGIDKVDGLVNLVGELVITQAMLSRFAGEFESGPAESLRDGLAQLERNTRELQESVLRIRMLPIGSCFNRFPRLVHDLSARLGKKVELELSGEGTELDKTVLEKIGDPLVHLVRNALDHGIEPPGARVAAGKPETGRIRLEAFHAGGTVVIRVVDDGAGLSRESILAKALDRGLVEDGQELTDEQVLKLVFHPGFSTASEVSDISGRGVGMDVVRRNIEDLGGHVELSSEPGRGSTVEIGLPLTLAILDGQLVRVGGETYIISLLSIVESLQVKRELVSAIAGRAEVYNFREEQIPVIRLHRAWQVEPERADLERGLLVVVEADGRRVGLFVDELLGQQQVVIKSLETNFRPVPGLAGATILGDGTVALILDVSGLVRHCFAADGHPPPRSATRDVAHVA